MNLTSVNKRMTLTNAKAHQYYQIKALPNNHEKETRLIEQGIFVGCQLKLLATSPFNGPLAIAVHGSAFSLPSELAAEIEVEVV